MANKRFDLKMKDFDKFMSEDTEFPNYYKKYHETGELPEVKTCKCCRKRFIPKEDGQEFCNDSCKASYKAQVEFINHKYLMDSDINGCYFHDDCFSCPFDDCIL